MNTPDSPPLSALDREILKLATNPTMCRESLAIKTMNSKSKKPLPVGSDAGLAVGCPVMWVHFTPRKGIVHYYGKVIGPSNTTPGLRVRRDDTGKIQIVQLVRLHPANAADETRRS